MNRRHSLCGIFFIFLLSACKTSGDVARNKEYVDPTDVKTEEDQETRPGKKGVSGDEDLRRQIAVLQGENESLQVLHAKELERLNQKIAELETENKKLKDAVGAEGDGESKPESVGDYWNLGLKQLEKQNYEKSAQTFGALVQNFPKSQLVFYAQLGRAMSLYGHGEFKEAALVFNQMIDRYPRKKEVTIAWFGQGSSFYKMGQRQDARLFFSEIVSRYPKSEEAPLAKRILEKKKSPPNDLFVVFPGWAKYAPQP